MSEPMQMSREQVQDLIRELAEARETYRLDVAQLKADRLQLKRDKDEIEQLRASARETRDKARTSYRRFMKQLKRRWSIERRAVAADRAELEKHRKDLEQKIQEQTQFAQQLRASWEQYQSATVQLNQEREQFERHVQDQSLSLERRAATVIQQEKHFDATQVELVERINALQTEINGLDERATNARMNLDRMEKQTDQLAKRDPFGDATSVVPIDAGYTVKAQFGGNTDVLLHDLHIRQQELDRARRKLIAARNELESQANTLDDQRAIFMDQVSSLMEARELWGGAELAMVDELEQIATALAEREASIVDQERLMSEARQRLEAEAEALLQVREQLESWRMLLLAEESATEATRRLAQAEWNGFQQQLQAKQTEMETIVRTWVTLRDRERQQFQQILDYYQSLQQSCEEQLPQAEAVRNHYLEEALKLAPLQLAVEHAIADQGLAGKRRLRVLQRRWDRHFQAKMEMLRTRESTLQLQAQVANDLQRTLQTTIQEWHEERRQLFDARIIHGQDAVVQIQYQRVEIPNASELMETELQRLRGEISRISEQMKPSAASV